MDIVISQKVREAEKNRQYEDFKDKQGQILSGIIKRLEYGNVIVDLGKAEGIVRKEELIQREILKNGDRIKINDPRLNPIWKELGKLNLPVLIHSGEPSSFWDPKDEYNERWLELRQKPNRYRDPEKNPSFEEILSEQHEMFKKNKNTIFINAHLGWMGNDLDRLSDHLDEYPNVYTEIGAVLAEIGLSLIHISEPTRPY